MNNYAIKQFSIFAGCTLLFFGVTAFTSPDASLLKEEDEKKINWLTIEEAQELSKDNPRKVIMDVYTDWCGWCKKMDKTTFSDEKVVEYVNEHFYAVKLKADSNDKVNFKGQEFTNAEFARALRVTGYPTVVFFDEALARITPVSGFRPAEDFLKLLEAFNQAEMGQ
ncbi:MAG: thioredoxin family protein [Cyclobacteriaceae bacterium]